ncbi:glycosyltransferase [Nocardia sp. ET3-3]|uniref:Glycosyltransferase n=1 Tax=Nocardia terrae TaxID=2675851 RepID=A0A7K1USK0_9NOCA|nr:glycosyltransferase family 2 protein [Nocardia terrae]MVU77326.1 glycosyltransferase [Nocardia terrae]
MRNSHTLVTVGLPVRNGAERIPDVVASVLAQDHADLELVISDNASTDATEEVCRDLADQDSRIVYHRNPVNVGLMNNFVGALDLAKGAYFRWIGDDDWLKPNYLSRCLEVFDADPRLLLVTTQLDYTGPDGVSRTAPYDGTALGSDDPVVRFTEMLRLLNESFLLIDPLYGVFRSDPVRRIARRNMLREDEVFAGKLALAGPWGHVNEVLGGRHFQHDRQTVMARKLGVPKWQAHLSTTLQCREWLRWIAESDLGPQQRWQARRAVAELYAERQRITAARGVRKLSGYLGSNPATSG